MSVINQVVLEAPTVAAAMPADVFDTVTNTANKASTAVKVVGGLIGLLVLVWVGWSRKGALGAFVSGAAYVVLFIWAINAIPGGKFNQEIDDTVSNNGMSSVGSATPGTSHRS